MIPEIEISGLQELERRLIAVGEEVGTKILRDAGRAAMAVVEADMKQNAGYDNSSTNAHMRDSIKIRSSRGKSGSTVVVLRVGPTRNHYMKALAQEFGTIKQVAKPFIRPALDYNKMQVLRILTIEIRDGLNTLSR
ncbi:tail protein [Yersinia phage vB_YenS-P840]|nr:tail protein [Yersinia phage vB_YenS-P840]